MPFSQKQYFRFSLCPSTPSLILSGANSFILTSFEFSSNFYPFLALNGEREWFKFFQLNHFWCIGSTGIFLVLKLASLVMLTLANHLKIQKFLRRYTCKTAVRIQKEVREKGGNLDNANVSKRGNSSNFHYFILAFFCFGCCRKCLKLFQHLERSDHSENILGAIVSA